MIPKEIQEKILKELFNPKDFLVYNKGANEQLIKVINKTWEEARRQIFCSQCGFPKEWERDIIILDSNPITFIECEENMCKECRHQKNGWTRTKGFT